MAQDVKKNAKESAESVDAASQEIAKEFEGSLETIKEILVGENTRELLKKFQALEEKMNRELASLQEQAMHRIEALESFIRKEILLVRDDLNSEQSERTGAVQHAAAEVSRVSQGLEQKLSQASQSASQQFKETREQLQGQSRSLAEEIVRSNKALYAEIERVAASIEARKPDRQSLAAMFVRMASALQVGPGGADAHKVAELKPKELKKSG